MINTKEKEIIDFKNIGENKFRIGVINYSGNIGKSLASDCLLRLHMIFQAHYVVSNQDTYNPSYSDKIIVSSESFNDVLKDLDNLNSAIVDISAHGTGQVIDIMRSHGNSHSVLDYFLIPVVKNRKESEDSLKAINHLLELGFSSNSIKILFNHVNSLENINDEFAYFLSQLDELEIPYDVNAAIPSSSFYPMLTKLDMSLSDLLSIPITEVKDRQNYLRTKNSTERTQEEYEEMKALATLHTAWRHAQTVSKNLTNVYSCLFPK